MDVCSTSVCAHALPFHVYGFLSAPSLFSFLPLFLILASFTVLMAVFVLLCLSFVPKLIYLSLCMGPFAFLTVSFSSRLLVHIPTVYSHKPADTILRCLD
uniref:Uncharacterized protein n=1 Tax=Trypanosoma vivax (strain Y486) TaxID=1055687 RepID=G0TTG3_TRYVY|nr:hypothetical protein TVY486_0304170 [Trypanosoma vivax Y486]